MAVAIAGAVAARPLAARFAAPAPDERNAHRLIDVSGHGRTAFWRNAWQEAEAHPLLGGGAGSWPRFYADRRHRLDGPANAHSLYLETLAELGPVGLALLLGFLALALARAPGPAALAVVAAFAVHAATDWDWQLPAVALPVLAAASRPAGVARARLPLATVALAVGVLASLHGIGAAFLETDSRPRLAARLLPYDARPWVAAGDRRRACRTDRLDLVLRRWHPPNGGCPPRAR